MGNVDKISFIVTIEFKSGRGMRPSINDLRKHIAEAVKYYGNAQNKALCSTAIKSVVSLGGKWGCNTVCAMYNLFYKKQCVHEKLGFQKVLDDPDKYTASEYLNAAKAKIKYDRENI